MSLYDDVDREAAQDWHAHRYEHDDRPTASELAREEAEALDLPGDEFWVNEREKDEYQHDAADWLTEEPF